MIKVETAKATKLQLDWGLAVAVGADHIWHYEGEVCAQFHLFEYEPYSHTDPAVWGGLIKEHKINVSNYDMSNFYPNNPDLWKAAVCFGSDKEWAYGDGDTPEQAIARCAISKVLGKNFEVPDELGVMG